MKLAKLVKVFMLSAVATTASATMPIDLNTPEGGDLALRKVFCHLDDNKVSYYGWKGVAYSRRMGEADKVLFNVEGMSARQCGTVDGGIQGETFNVVTREILLYTDTKTGKPLEKWNNPFTDEEVEVIHVTNDPVNQPPSFLKDKDGKLLPWKRKFSGEVSNNLWWIRFDVPLFYHNVLSGDYQKQIGGAYHATEMFDFVGDIDSLVNDDFAQTHVDWVRLSDWLPWMMMSGREGAIYIHASGEKLATFEELSPIMQTYINDHAPNYKTAPPTDDKRPNETSWSTYKDDVKGEKLKTTSRH